MVLGKDDQVVVDHVEGPAQLSRVVDAGQVTNLRAMRRRQSMSTGAAA
jgi:hypothetical protein